LRHAGGGARSSVWCQIRADVLGRPIDRVECVDAGVVGAAVLAGVAAGVFPSIEEAADRMVRLERTFEPNLALRTQYDEGFGRYTDLYARLKGFGGAPA
jgi:xylulokinase